MRFSNHLPKMNSEKVFVGVGFSLKFQDLFEPRYFEVSWNHGFKFSRLFGFGVLKFQSFRIFELQDSGYEVFRYQI
jgi:hypothetical protein